MSSWRELADRNRLLTHVPLGPLTTYKLGGPARLLVEVEDADDLVSLAGGIAETPLPVLVLGRGSNVLISDRGFDGVVVHLGPGFSWVRWQEGLVSAGGSTSLPNLARTAARAGQGSLEFYVGIPGSVGGAVRMNAGCHGSETADVLETADVFDLLDGTRSARSPEDLDLGYRHSNLGDHEVVVSATFHTVPVEPAAAEGVMREVSRWRKEHQPGGTLNAGSVFKNPPGDAAGRIIDEVGLKGYRVGSVSVSHKHGNFFVAERAATAQDVHDLVFAVREIVRERSGVELIPEIRFVGDFDDEPQPPPAED
ncbi:MAG TPA: UDP-N-acetylmuramate dehydrogenase [Acidimicrobiia bacterium]|nr:UDP-N-acetylmuramate dehydrogenase [Acidimicrobiia bacterium]